MYSFPQFYIHDLTVSPRLYYTPVDDFGVKKQKLDFVRSSVISFYPSIVETDILLKGHLSIAGKSWYTSAEVDYEQVYGLYKLLKNHLINSFLSYKKIYKIYSITGERSLCSPGFYASTGAFKWQNSGKQLKQGINEPQYFEITV